MESESSVVVVVVVLVLKKLDRWSPGGRDTPYSGLYGEAPPETQRAAFFKLAVY